MSAWTAVAGSLPAWWIAWLWCLAVRRNRQQTAEAPHTRTEFDPLVLQLADLDAQ